MKWLVEKGAGKNARNNDGITPLDAAYARIESDEFDSDARKAKREVGEYLDSIGAEKKEVHWYDFLCCFSCPALFFFGILYAAFTKPKPEEIPTPSKPIMVTTSPQIAGKKVVQHDRTGPGQYHPCPTSWAGYHGWTAEYRWG